MLHGNNKTSLLCLTGKAPARLHIYIRRTVFAAAFVLALCAQAAHAACTNPAGETGQILFNQAYDVFQGCTERGWQAFHAPQPPPSGCPNIGDQCDDNSYYIGQVGGNDIYATAAASEASRQWDDGTSENDPADSTTDGEGNTANLVADGPSHPAAEYCDGLSAHGHSDWYLPAKDELNQFWNGGTPVAGVNTGGSWYWSSTEGTVSVAWIQRFDDGSQNGSSGNKNLSLLVRCVRR